MRKIAVHQFSLQQYSQTALIQVPFSTVYYLEDYDYEDQRITGLGISIIQLSVGVTYGIRADFDWCSDFCKTKRRPHELKITPLGFTEMVIGLAFHLPGGSRKGLEFNLIGNLNSREMKPLRFVSILYQIFVRQPTAKTLQENELSQLVPPNSTVQLFQLKI